MKLNDFIFEYTGNRKYAGLCRVRTFINNEQNLYVVITDLDIKNPAGSVTNDVKSIYSELILQGYIDKRYKVIEHYEETSGCFLDDGKYGEFSVVSFNSAGAPNWKSCKVKEILKQLDVDEQEFLNKTWNNHMHLNMIERKRMKMNPYFDYSYVEDPTVVRRRLEIEEKKISKEKLLNLVENGAIERELQSLLKTDLSIFAEVYAHPAEEYICFSEFPIGEKGKVDFAIFTGRSRMDVTLVEIKGADFSLMAKSNGYRTFAKKMEIGISQAKERSGYVYRNYEKFREFVHVVRQDIEKGETMYNSLLGPAGSLQVDPNKDINLRYIVIGGRTDDDLKESWRRHEHEKDNNPPLHIETWDTFCRRLTRK